MKILLMIVFVIAVVALGPTATIWALNTLFPSLNIPLSLETWCAVVVLGGVFKTNVTTK